MFTSVGGIITTIAGSTGSFSFFDQPVVNEAGQVAFIATLDAGGTGIFTGPNDVADKAIRMGDTLFGSTVTGLGFNHGLNDLGQIAFRYTLANGESGIAVATPTPEPATFWSFAIAVLAWVTACRGVRIRRPSA